MDERRTRHRRRYLPVARFPLSTKGGEWVPSERRMLPTRRVNDIEVREISCQDFISGLS